jgi:hypothetical protein
VASPDHHHVMGFHAAPNHAFLQKWMKNGCLSIRIE